MTVFNTYSDLSPRTNLYAAANFLKHAVPKMVTARYAERMPMPKNKTLTIKFRRCVPFDVSVTPLQEGVTPQGQSAQFEDVSVSLKQYGNWVQLTDVIADTHEDPVLNKFSLLSGEQAGQTVEAINWGILQGGTSVYYSSTTSSPTLRTQVNAPITLQLQRKVEKFLDAQYATKWTKPVDATSDWGQEPVPEAYVALCHTDNKPDLYDLPNFTKIEKYASGKPEPSEVGKCENTRYVASAFLKPFLAAGSTTLNGMASVGGAAVDVYSIVYMGKEAWGSVPLAGREDFVLGIYQPGRVGFSISDPLGQRGFVAWKMWYAALILNQNWIVRVECGTTA